MNSKAKPSNQANLLAAIQRKVPVQPEPLQEPPVVVPVPETNTVEKKARRSQTDSTASIPKSKGQPVQFWLHDEDRRIVRELAAWLAGQGQRPTDSLVIRAVLHTVKANAQLLDAYRQAAQLDGRLKQHKAS